jgi:hypothetical protein
MKPIMLFSALLLGLTVGRSLAQGHASQELKNEVKKFAYLAGAIGRMKPICIGIDY